jgi:hypothetical protein
MGKYLATADFRADGSSSSEKIIAWILHHFHWDGLHQKKNF